MVVPYKERKEYCDEHLREWRRKNPDKQRLIGVRYQRKLRKRILDLLGNKCIKCGYSGLALQVDHVKNNGTEERTKYGKGSTGYWLKILRELKNGSKDYQCLCANCNWEKELRRRMV